jgi:hypothetical protein
LNILSLLAVEVEVEQQVVVEELVDSAQVLDYL